MDKSLRPVVVFILAFTLLGMPGSALSVVWPSMAEDLHRSLGDLGILTATSGVMYGIVSLFSGAITKRMRAGRLLTVAVASAVIGLVVMAIADGWALLVLAVVPVGLAGGAIDSIGNAYVAVFRGSRAMGLIHAAFGLGSMIAPVVITVLFALGLSWRIGFAILAVAESFLAGAFFVTRTQIRMPMEGRSERPVRRGRKRLLAGSIWVFMAYAAVEGSLGTWLFTLLSEGQGVSVTIAGVAVALHWAGLFASRLTLGIAGDRIPANRTITASSIGLVVGCLMIWWNPSDIVSISGAVLAGFASGPVFPLQMSLNTPRFGPDFTPWAVGYQLTAVTLAIAFVPVAIGITVNRLGPLAIAPALVALAILSLLSVEGLRLLFVGERRTAPEGADG